MLDLVYDGLPLHKGLSAQDVASLIRLSNVLLRDAPEGVRANCLMLAYNMNHLICHQEHPKSAKHTRRDP